MNTQEAIGATFSTSSMVLNAYFSDLTDAELMTRPAEGCNHLAWQLGHLISSECHLLESLAPGSAVDLPDGFAEQHSKENASEDDASKFCSKPSVPAEHPPAASASTKKSGPGDDSLRDFIQLRTS